MAASVQPRQFGHLEPGSAPVCGAASSNGAKAYPPANGIPHRADSPVRGCGFPPLVSPPSRKPPSDGSDDEEEEQEDWRELYGSHLQLEVEPSVRDARDEGTADAWIERNPLLIRLTGKHPLNCEAPLARLMHHGFITPAALHFVRNHGAVPRGDWSTWTVEVTGLVKRPMRLTMDELVNGFPAVEVPVTLACSGNRRKEQNMVQQTVGFNFGAAAVSTSVWHGARLRDVLRRCGIMPSKGGALNVCFEGAEDLPGGGGSKYGTSITRQWALDPSRDIMLAYMQNGEPLLPDHGFPVRAIIPGCTGGRMVKWVKRIIVTTAESDNYYHYKDNRVFPSHVDAELANADAWWYKPEYIINELNVNSVITAPGHDEILPINGITTQRGYTMKGYAYSGEDKIFPILRLSYDDLPSHMKQCFAFCAIFPKDYEIDVETLIQLWLAHDFIPLQEEDHLETVAQNIFKELVWRSFFQDVNKISQREENVYRSQLRDRTTCKIHDLMHDISQSVMGKECLSIIGSSNLKNLMREHPLYHVLIPYTSIALPDDFMGNEAPALRTLLFRGYYGNVSTSHLFKYNSLQLRALELTRREELPIRPRHLQHLRYLNLSDNSNIHELPADISTMYNLQTLNLSDCYNLVRLPKDMKYMTSLRHLYTNGCSKLKYMPPDLGQLTSFSKTEHLLVITIQIYFEM
ncbi:hypothetical protein OsI_29541 [Oryza sativa Indica Group]|uniref:Nitrate reductase n=1 Tax=Oryza sativa subsp. indica TaxID=39946 RepID=A2YW32_ORYSI|nr:hypothetical protein OsI_29541 [Oryza sativa Indica Group]